MNRALVLAAIIAVLGGAYIFFTKSEKAPVTWKPATPVAMTVREERIRESTDVYDIDAEYPQFSIPNVDADIKAFLEAAISEFKKEAVGPLVTSAKYEFVSKVDSTYADDHLLSAKVITSTYMGGAHGMPVVNGLNFDRATGKQLTLDDALKLVGLTLNDVAAKAKTELETKLGEDIIAPEGADATVDNYSTFVVDKDKVTFIFQVYQVAPYAAGAQEVSFERK